MGDFITATEMKRHALVPLINQLDNDVLDMNFILPSERAIAEACNLNLDTDGEPWAWSAYFDNFPSKRTKYLDDYKRATIMTVNHLASNPLGMGSQSVGGASSTFSTRLVPPLAKTLMNVWGEPRRLMRV